MLTVVLVLGAGAAGSVALGRVRTIRRIRRLGRSRAPEHERRARIPAVVRIRLSDALERARITASPEEAVLGWVASGVAATVVAFALSPFLAVLVVAAVVVSGPLVLHLRRHRRHDEIREGVPDLLDEVARDLRAGGTVGSAIDRLAGNGSFGAGLEAFHTARAGGAGVVDAVDAWRVAHDSAPAPLRTAVQAAAGALVTATSTGGRSAYAIEGVAEALRAEIEAEKEAAAQAAQGRASATVIGALAPASLVFGAVLSPDTVAVLFTHPAGNVALAAGLTCEVLGVWWMRNVLRPT